MLYNYSKILKVIPYMILIYEESGYIYFLADDYKNGSLLLEERKDCIILWSNILDLPEFKTLYKAFKDNLPVPLYAVYVETEKEYNAAIELGCESVAFTGRDYPQGFGSFIL